MSSLLASSVKHVLAIYHVYIYIYTYKYIYIYIHDIGYYIYSIHIKKALIIPIPMYIYN